MFRRVMIRITRVGRWVTDVAALLVSAAGLAAAVRASCAFRRAGGDPGRGGGPGNRSRRLLLPRERRHGQCAMDHRTHCGRGLLADGRGARALQGCILGMLAGQAAAALGVATIPLFRHDDFLLWAAVAGALLALTPARGMLWVIAGCLLAGTVV